MKRQTGVRLRAMAGREGSASDAARWESVLGSRDCRWAGAGGGLADVAEQLWNDGQEQEKGHRLGCARRVVL